MALAVDAQYDIQMRALSRSWANSTERGLPILIRK